jgi:hypothetical protein
MGDILENIVFPYLLVLICLMMFVLGAGVASDKYRASISGMSSFIIGVISSSAYDRSQFGDYWLFGIVLQIFSFNFGMIFWMVCKNKKDKNIVLSISSQLSVLIKKKPVRVVFVAFIASIFATFVFSRMVNWSSGAGFWYGFYQSWTSGFAAFIMFGLAGIAVSIHRPGEDHFQQRVANLFNVTDAASIDYLSQAIQKIGYYSVSSERLYRIVEYDEKRKIYKINVQSTTVARNFLHDVRVPDKLTYGMHPHEDEKYEPPISHLGLIHKIKIDGVSQIPEESLPMEIPLKGIMMEWRIDIAPGQDANIEIMHSGHFLAGMDHDWIISRYAKNIKVYFEYACGSKERPRLTVESDGVPKDFSIKVGEKFLVAELSNRPPGTRAIRFNLSVPE